MARSSGLIVDGFTGRQQSAIKYELKSIALLFS